MTDFDSILQKAKWWSKGTTIHYGEDMPIESYSDLMDTNRHGIDLSVLDDGDLVKLYDCAPDYGWLFDDCYDGGKSIAAEIFRRVGVEKDLTDDDTFDILDSAVDSLRNSEN